MTHNGVIDGVRRISGSEIRTFKACPRQWWLAWYRGLRFDYEAPVEKKHNGDRVHRALAPWYVPEGDQRVDPRATIESVIREDRDLLAGRLVASGQSPDESADFAKLVKLNDLERIMIDGYMEWLEETGVDEGLEVIASETYLERTLYPYHSAGDYEVRLVGKIDVRVRRKSDGARVFLDHKTVDSFPQFDELSRNEQMPLYDLLELADEHNVTPDDRCDGAYYNMLRRVKRTARATPPFYDRVHVPINAHKRSSFTKQTLHTVDTILAVEKALNDGSDHFIVGPNATRDCGWKCSFAAICSMFDDGSRVEDLLDRHYIAGDPLHYYGDIIGVHPTND